MNIRPEPHGERTAHVPEISIVIPCYGSAASLEELLEGIAKVLGSTGEPFEVVLVNDGSPDETWNVILSLADRYDFVRGIDLQFNTGQYRATLCGLEHAFGQVVITMDDDLQHPPGAILVLLEALRAAPAVDCVMARFEEKRHSAMRNLGSRLMGQIQQRLYGKPPDVRNSSYRAMTRRLVETLISHGTVNPVLGPLIFSSTRRVRNVTVEHQPRRHGRSGYSPFRLCRIVLDSVFSATTLPLRIVSALGLLSAGGALLLGIFYLLIYLLRGIAVPGFATQVLLIIFFGGMTLFAIGLVGEYLIRVIDEVRRPPRYAVRETCGGERAASAARRT